MKDVIKLKPSQLLSLLQEETNVKGFENWTAEADHDKGTFDAEKGSMVDYKITLKSPEGLKYVAYDGYYNASCGDCFYDDIVFNLKKKKVK